MVIKILFILFFSVGVYFLIVHQPYGLGVKPAPAPELIKNVSSRVEARYVQVAPAGCVTVTNYYFEAKIVECRNDTITVIASTADPQAKAIVYIHSNKKLAIGSTVLVSAETWGGAGWRYTIKES